MARGASLADYMDRVRRRLATAALLPGLLAAVLAVRAALPAASGPTASAEILATPTPTPTASPAPTPTEPAGPLLPQSEVLLPELASDAFASPRMALRWRGRGDDDARAAGFLVEVRQVGLRAEADWRTLVPGSPARTTTFTGAPGEAYAVRVSERTEGSGNYGPAATASVLVPLDERDRRVKLSRGWRRHHRRGAWSGTTASAASSRATAKLRFAERRV